MHPSVEYPSSERTPVKPEAAAAEVRERVLEDDAEQAAWDRKRPGWHPSVLFSDEKGES